jgi:hypothetical protein
MEDRVSTVIRYLLIRCAVLTGTLTRTRTFDSLRDVVS